MFQWLARMFQSPRDDAEKQQGDVHALDRTDDPRGGVQSEAYRHGSPLDVVEEGDVAVGGPGGAVPDDSTPDERRERDRADGGG